MKSKRNKAYKYYDWYRANNKLKSKYFKVGATAAALAFALFALPAFGALFSGLGFLLAVMSIFEVNIPTVGKFILPYGLFVATIFNCNYGLGNTGTACVPLQKVFKKIILVPYYTAHNNQNKLLLNPPGTVAASASTVTGTNTTFTTTFEVGDIIVVDGDNTTKKITAIASATSLTVDVAFASAVSAGAAYNDITNIAYYTGLVNHPDPNKRWYPLPFMKNAKDTRGASIMKTYDDNTEAIVQAGVRKFTSIIPGNQATPQLQGKLKQVGILDFGFYGIDKDSNLIGVSLGDGNLYPIRVDQNSFDPIYNPGDDKTEPELQINFNVHANEIDSQRNVLSYLSLNSINIGGLNGLIDVFVTYSSPTLTTVLMKLYTLYGDVETPVTVHGLAKTDFYSPNTGASGEVYDVTSNADLAISSVVEQTDAQGNGNGTYLITFATATLNDVIRIQPKKNGFDFSSVSVATFVA